MSVNQSYLKKEKQVLPADTIEELDIKTNQCLVEILWAMQNIEKELLAITDILMHNVSGHKIGS